MMQSRRLAHATARARIGIVLVGALLLAQLLAPALADAAGALTSLTTPATSSTPTTTTVVPTGPATVAATTSSTSSGGLSQGDYIAIFIAAGVLILGIARIIVRDARGHTPAGELPDFDRPKGTVAPIEHRLRRSRAKAKRARRARRAGR